MNGRAFRHVEQRDLGVPVHSPMNLRENVLVGIWNKLIEEEVPAGTITFKIHFDRYIDRKGLEAGGTSIMGHLGR